MRRSMLSAPGGGVVLRTEIRKSRVPYSAPRPSRLDGAMTAMRVSFPHLTMNFTGASQQGSVRISAVTLADLISQAPDLEDLHYLLVECTSSASPQVDAVRIEFGSPDGISRLHAFSGWFRRIQEWDVRVTAQSASAHEADRLLNLTLSVLRGHKISATRALLISVVPALFEIVGLCALVLLAVFRVDPSSRVFGSALICMFYWRIAFILVPHRAYIYLRARSTRMSRLLGWSPSPRAQALWAVGAGVAGLIALVISVLAWLAPRS